MTFIRKLLPSKAWHWALSGAGLFALMIFCGFIIAESAKAEVVIAADDDKQTVKTHADTVKDLLEEEDIAYSSHDGLSHDIDAPIEDGMTIKYDEAKKLTLTMDGTEDVYYTTADTISEFLDNQDLTVDEYDETSHPAEAEIADGMDYTITKAFNITIDDAGEKKDIHPVKSQSVEQLLDEHDIELNKLDQVTPSLDETIEQGDDIQITRIEKSRETVDEAIAYDTEERADEGLDKGETKVVEEGKKGTVAKTFEVTTENGEAVDRQLMNQKVKQESNPKVVVHGTKEKESNETKDAAENDSDNNEESRNKNKTSTHNNHNDNDNDNENDHDNDNNNDDHNNAKQNQNNSSKRQLEMNATAYTVDCLGCNGEGLTATGINLHENPRVVAVDPDVIPLGSRVWVEGYGNAIAGDTGGNIQGNRIDLHVTSKSKANSFGRQTVTVKVLD